MNSRFYSLAINIVKLFRIKICLEILALKNFVSSKKVRAILSKEVFVGDGIITQQIDPRSNKKLNTSFTESFNLVPNQLKSLRDMYFRFEILIWAMKQTQGITGGGRTSGIVECGVWYGVLSKALINYFKNQDSRTFYLFDSWGEKNFVIKGFYKKGNYKKDIYDIVKTRFKSDNVSLIRGELPNSLKNNLPKKVSLLLIDLNSGIVEIQVLKFCWPRIPKGGIIYIDDYNLAFPKVISSINSFVKQRNQNLLIFPTGQAIIIKS